MSDLLGGGRSAPAGLTAEQRQLLDDCRARDRRLNDDERRFLVGIDGQSFALTSSQDARLNEIWDRVT